MSRDNHGKVTMESQFDVMYQLAQAPYGSQFPPPGALPYPMAVLPYPDPLSPMIPTCWYDGPDLGPAACIIIQSSKSFGAPGSFSVGVNGSALVFMAIIVVFLIVLTVSGYILGFLRARSKTMRRKIPSLTTPDSYNAWKRERNSTLLTFVLMFTGIAFFLFGLNANVELQIPYAKVVTSAPGIVLIVLGYLLWTRAYSSKGSHIARDN